MLGGGHTPTTCGSSPLSESSPNSKSLIESCWMMFERLFLRNSNLSAVRQTDLRTNLENGIIKINDWQNYEVDLGLKLHHTIKCSHNIARNVCSTYVILNACTTAGLALLDQQCVPIGQTTVSIQALDLGGSTKGSLTSSGLIFKLVILRNRTHLWR